MSEENRNSKNPTQQNNIEIINEKLSSAAKTLTDADAEAKARLAEERRRKADGERLERTAREESDRLRKDEERRARELRAKKEAELAYAETYRKRLREERERAALNAAKQKALQKKEDERRAAQEELERERAARLRQGLEEAERRNAESDSLVDIASTKAKENEKAAAELEAKRASMKEVPPEYRADNPREAESFVISEGGVELFAEKSAQERIAAEKSDSIKEPVRTQAEPAERLSSEDILAALEERLKGDAPGELSAKEGESSFSAPMANSFNSDEKDVFPSTEESDLSSNKKDDGRILLSFDEEYVSRPESGVKTASDEGYVITLGEDETDYFSSSDRGLASKARESAALGGSKDVSAEYLFGSTFDMMTRSSDYSHDYEKRRKNAEETIKNAGEAAASVSAAEPSAAFTEEYVLSSEGQEAVRIRKRLEKEEEKAFRRAEKTLKKQSRYKDMKKPESEAPESGDTSEVIAAQEEPKVDTGASVFANYDEDEAKINALKDEKANLERRMREMETANRNEIDLLGQKEDAARRELLRAEFSAKEAAYRMEIDALSARLYEMESAHAEQKQAIESSIAGYESSRLEFSSPTKNQYTGAVDYTHGYESQYEDEGLISGFDKYNSDRLDRAAIRDERKRFADIGDENLITDGYDRRAIRPIPTDSAMRPDDYSRDYEDANAIDGYNKRNERLSTTDTGDVSDSELDAFASEMKIAEGEENERIMRKKDLKRLLNKSAKREEKLIKTEKKKRAKQERAKDGAAIILLTECIELEKKLLESYICDLRYCIAADIKKYKKRYAKRIDLLADEFNADLEVWRRQTGAEAESVSSSLSADILAGMPIPQLPEIYYSDTDTAKKKKRLSPADIERMREEQLLLIKEEARRERERKKRAETESGIIPGRNVPVTKSQIDKDMTVVSERIAYRENRYSYVVAKSRFHFGEESGKEKKARKKALAKLRRIRSAKRDVIRDAKKNNARYYEVATQDAETVKARFKADRAKMKDLSARMRALIHERDEINGRLLALYSEESRGKGGKPKKNQASSLKLKETKRAFKRQLSLYKRISRYRLPLKKKQKIYDLMNRKVELCVYLAEMRYRIKHEDRKSDFKKELKTAIKDTLRQLKYTERDIEALSKKLAKRAARGRNPRHQMLWLVLLIILIVGGLVGYFFFREQIAALFLQLFGSIFGTGG